jgi:hypothetical protein
MHMFARVCGRFIAIVPILILLLGTLGPGQTPNAPKAPPYTRLGLAILAVALGIQLPVC